VFWGRSKLYENSHNLAVKLRKHLDKLLTWIIILFLFCFIDFWTNFSIHFLGMNRKTLNGWRLISTSVRGYLALCDFGLFYVVCEVGKTCIIRQAGCLLHHAGKAITICYKFKIIFIFDNFLVKIYYWNLF